MPHQVVWYSKIVDEILKCSATYKQELGDDK